MNPEPRSTTDPKSQVPAFPDWILCEVTEVVTGDVPGTGLYHCVRMVPDDGRLGTEWRETETMYRFCGWWTKTRPALAVGNRVWVKEEYDGRNLIMLAEC